MNKSMEITKNIPHDVIATNILTRLPAKCLGRCKCVCKAWKSHIDDPKFVESHHDFTIQSESNLSLIVSTKGSSLYIFNNFLDPTTSSPRHATPLVLPNSFPIDTDFKIIGSQNGLVCLGSGKTLNRYFMLNPNMPRYPKILSFSHNVDECLPTAGFGYDIISEVYKVVYVCILTKYYGPQLQGMIYNSIIGFGSGSGTWTRLEPPMYYVEPLPKVITKWVFCGSLNNSLHFVGRTDTNVIITFDLHDEVWGEKSLPCCIEIDQKEVNELGLEEGYESYEVIDVCILKGCLSALVIDHGCRCPYFWVLKDYAKYETWTKLFKLPNLRNIRWTNWYTLPTLRNVRVLYYWTREYKPLVLLLHEYNGVVWFDYEEGKTVEIVEIGNGSASILDAKIVFAGSWISVPGVRPPRDDVGSRKGGRNKGKLIESEDGWVKESSRLEKKTKNMEKKKTKNKNKSSK